MILSASLLSLVLLDTPGDTLRVRTADRPPSPAAFPDTASLGSPSVRLQTGQGHALIWILRVADTAFVVAHIPDTTRYWGDDLVIGLDVAGDKGPAPRSDDVQWYFRRALDSSVVFHGRDGVWQPPGNDPGWRLGRDRSGMGWQVTSMDRADGWTLTLRLDSCWLAGEAGRLPRIGFRIYDDAPEGWHEWPPSRAGAPPRTVERTPALWAAVLLPP